ncbi:MAG: hypothetical protein RLY86_2529 [Pseudomonadota bacterium]|jgi:surfeit locus 1 family protein
MTDSAAAAHRRFRPRLGMTIAAGLAMAILIAFGSWQVERLGWKTELIQRIEAGLAQEPVALPTAVDDPAAWDYRPVSVTGTFLHDRELYLGPRTLKGRDGLNQTGVHVLTPLLRADGLGTVLVDRGFVPADRQDPATRADGQVQGVVTVSGIARVPQGQVWLQPDNRPQGNFWFWMDLPAMAASRDLTDLSPLVVQAGDTPNPGGWPVGGRTIVTLTNNHLSYALTWYGLALTLLGVWAAASFRRV